MSNNKWSPKHGVQSVYRALRLLRYICTADNHRGVSLTELAQFIGLSKPSVYRLLSTLEAFHFVSKDPYTGLYRPGSGLLELASLGLERLELRSIALPHLEDLWRATNETVHLAILEDGEVVYIEKRESQQTVRMYSAVGRRAPAHCTGLGKAMLAFLPPSERKMILEKKGLRAYTERTITSLAAFERECEKIRKKGYALDLGEHEPDIRCVAAPIFDHMGRPIAALSVAIPAFRAGDKEHLQELGPMVVHAAQAVSNKLGYSRKLKEVKIA